MKSGGKISRTIHPLKQPNNQIIITLAITAIFMLACGVGLLRSRHKISPSNAGTSEDITFDLSDFLTPSPSIINQLNPPISSQVASPISPPDPTDVSNVPSDHPSLIPSFSPSNLSPSGSLVVPYANPDAMPIRPSWWTPPIPNGPSFYTPPFPDGRTSVPSDIPSLSPSEQPTNTVTYQPGLLDVNFNGLLLSQGLEARIVATSGKPVQYGDGSESEINFHDLPDGADIFADTRSSNSGGWIYTSNSEVQIPGEGGVGAITFNSDGEIIDYRMVLTGSTHNCGGGRTPWNTWISCEELFSDFTGEGSGEIYQVDPTGERQAQVTSVGAGYGRFESFAYDVRNPDLPKFFATEDRRRGAVRRFIPSNPDWTDPWTMLHGNGTLQYLTLMPLFKNATTGVFTWIDDLFTAQINAAHNYPECEGIGVDGNLMYLVSKKWKSLWILDLDAQTFERFSTASGVFDGRPDQVVRVLADDDDESILYFTEEGGLRAGVHGRNRQGQFFTIVEHATWKDETTGLAFSPDGMHMLVAYQDHGVVYDITRNDGFPFHGRSLNVKYHATNG